MTQKHLFVMGDGRYPTQTCRVCGTDPHNLVHRFADDIVRATDEELHPSRRKLVEAHGIFTCGNVQISWGENRDGGSFLVLARLGFAEAVAYEPGDIDDLMCALDAALRHRR